MTDLTHEEVSELLGPYSSGELEGSTHARVDTHLATCAECTRELAGITAIRAFDIEPMTGPERDRITTAVRAAVVPAARLRWSERFGRGLAPALGAAAVVVVAVIGYVSFQGDGSAPADLSAPTQDEADDSTTGTTLEDAGGAASGAQQKARGEVRGGDAESTQTLEMEVAAPGADSAAGSVASEAPQPISVVIEPRFAATKFTRDLFAPRDAKKSNRTLAFGAGPPGGFIADDPTVAATVEDCARTVIETSPHPALTPTYAAHFPTDDIIVIGFVWRAEGSGALNFELRGWRGGSCDSVSPIYRSGPV